MKISKTHFFNFKEASIAYQIYGRGPSVVFLHGYCEDSFIWQSGIKRWSKTHTCITIDLPGFGKSSLLKGYSIEDLGDMVAALLSQLSIAKVSLIGHSMGGYVALAFAKKYPLLLSSIGLIHSHCFDDNEAKKANRRKSIDFIKRHGTSAFLTPFYTQLFAAENFAKHKHLIADLTRRNASLSVEAIITGAEALINRPSFEQVLKSIDCPVLIFGGGQDAAIAKEQTMKMATMPAIADFYFEQNVGHMGFFECKSIFEKAVSDFLERI